MTDERGKWEEMGDRLNETIALMLAGGWVERSDARERDYDADAGDLLSCQLARAGAHIEVALRDDDAIVVWDLNDDLAAGTTEDASSPLFVVYRETFQQEAVAHGFVES